MAKLRLFEASSLNGIPQRTQSFPVQTNQSDGTLSLLFRWKKSVYKLLWKHLLVYAIVYVLLSIIYEFVLQDNGKKNFKAVAEYCSTYTRSINLMIMLGFFTSTAMQRLFNMQTTMPGTAKSITVFMSSLKSDLPEGPLIVDQFARWQLLAWVLTFRLICRPLRKSLPDLISLQASGLLTNEERKALEDAEMLNSHTPRPLIVIDWMLLLLKDTLINQRFFCEFNYLKNVDLLMAFKKSCGNTIKFATQNIPPAVIQAVMLACYGFGLVTLMGRCFSEDDSSTPATMISFIPLLPAMQFFIYFAWLCFGIAAFDPFGDDEDDIDVQSLVQSHIEDSLRLRELYNKKLGDVFPKLSHKMYNDSVPL